MVWIVGVDEAGRGPLAGPVTAAAVVLNDKTPILGLRDSKKLSALQRDKLRLLIEQQALAWHVACCSPEEIDQLNILNATLLAMKKAVDGLLLSMGWSVDQVKVLVDGNRLPNWPYAAQAIVKGDAKEQAISAASILAKTHRDSLMLDLHEIYPCYGFNEHMG
jgi:ribonuclease HII